MNRREFLTATAAGAALTAIGIKWFPQAAVKADELPPLVGTDWIEDFGPDGAAYIRDNDLHSIVRRTTDGTTAWDVGDLDPDDIAGAGNFNLARGIAVSPDGTRVYVVDVGNARVQAFDVNGQFQFAFGTYGAGDGEFLQPTDIAIDSTGLLYVTDRHRHDVQVFTSNGVAVGRFGEPGDGDDQLNGPIALGLDPNGNVHVADSINARIQTYSPAGAFLGSYGSYGTELGQFISPRAIAIDETGRRYIADPFSGYVTVFSPTGVATDRFLPILGGKQGVPLNVVITPGGQLYVAVLLARFNHVASLPVISAGYQS